MYTYLVTTGFPEQWKTTDTIEEALEIRETYLEDHPHEDVNILENLDI